VETGPDTFAVFERSKGSVKLSSAYRFSGYRSVELRDVVGDHDFPELQGYFPARRNGRLFAHFALLTTDAGDILNVALAGPKWFTLAKDGIGFWLKRTASSGRCQTACAKALPASRVRLVRRRRRLRHRPRALRLGSTRRANQSRWSHRGSTERGRPTPLGRRQVLVRHRSVRTAPASPTTSTTW
jgi:hypothetical protein